MISNTKIKLKLRKKTNNELVETIRLAIKNKHWIQIAHMLSGPTRKYARLNLSEIDKDSKIGDTLIIPGKVLSKGELTKKIRICALSISKQAEEKLKQAKSEFFQLSHEIKKNPKAEGIKILK